MTPIAFRDNAPSIVAGVGADAAVGRRMALGAELRYRRTFSERQGIFGFESPVPAT